MTECILCGNPAVGLQCPSCLSGGTNPLPVFAETAAGYAPRLPDEAKHGKPAVQHHDRMNKTEAAWAIRLESDADVAAWWFGAVKFRLADRSWYTPDFVVQVQDGRFIVYETKGPYIREDAMVKFRGARERYPHFDWQMWQRDGDWKWSRVL